MAKVVREICIAGAVITETIKGSTHVKGRIRAPKANPSREAVQRNNDRIAAKRLAAILNANFFPGDWHITLTYGGIEPNAEEADKELSNFLNRMKREYKKAGLTFKYVAVTEFKNHRIHHHIVMPFIDATTVLKQWKRGRVRLTDLDRSRNYRKLAEYLIKETTKTFREAGNVFKKRYRCSQNLEKPVIYRQVVSEKQLHQDPKPFKGYVIDEESIRRYECLLTGVEHMEFYMVATDPVPRLKTWRGKNSKIIKKGESLMRFDEIKQEELDFTDGWELI